jgi:multisubunit Na+/H+ antiporter MnhC subunit
MTALALALVVPWAAGIVIGLAVTALLLVLVLRVALAFRSRRIDEVADEEAARDAQLEREEAAAR